MKLWNQVVLSGLVLALALNLTVNNANAQSTKKKKKKVVVEEKHVVKHVMMEKLPIEGGNLAGKPGYFFADTATPLNQGQLMGAAHVSFDTWGNAFQIPIGVSYGITDKILINVNTAFYSVTGASGLNNLGFGGKYSFKNVAKGLDVAAGLDFTVGPLSNNLGASEFGFDPYGVATYTFRDGLQLNGKLGLYIQTYSTPSVTVDGYTFQGYSGSYSFFQLDLGAAYPFDRNLTGIAELATNGVVNEGGLGGTPLIVGIRTGHDVQFQAFGGLDLGGQVGLLVGGGIVLVSK